MQYIVYIPTSLNSPEFEILLSKAQILIDQKKNVEIITLGKDKFTGKVHATSKNIFSQSLIDKACFYKRKLGFQKLRGKFKITYINDFEDHYNKFAKKRKKTPHQIKKINFFGIDFGTSALSSYLGLSRDANLEGLIAENSLNRILNTSLNVFFFFKKKLKTKNFSVYLYNGRHSEYRPIVRLCKKLKIHCSVLEFCGDGEKNIGIQEFKNHLPTDLKQMKNLLNNFWKKKKNRKNKCDYYFKYKRAGRVINDRASYILKQNKNLLPYSWDNSKINIVYFTSSQDEYFTLGGEYDKTVYKHQNHSIYKIVNSLKKIKKKDIHLYIRVHPYLEKVFWKFNREIEKLHDPENNIFVIPPGSKISSYKMMSKSNKVITYNSQTGIEAVYWKKPSILLGRRIYEDFKSCYIPKNHQHMMKLLLKKNLKPRSPTNIGALKFAAFWVLSGLSYKYFQGSMKNGYKFKSSKINFNSINFFIYNLGKFIQYYIFNYLINYKLRNKKSLKILNDLINKKFL